MTKHEYEYKPRSNYLNLFPKFNKKQFANTVTSYETWVHYFESLKTIGNKIKQTKHSRRPEVA